MIYILPLILLLIFAIYREYSNNYAVNRNKPIFYMFLSYLMIIMAFRYRVGIDTLNYMVGYESVEEFGRTSFKEIFEQFEPLNVLLRSLAKSISDDFVVYQIFHVFILNVLIARFIIKHTRHILFALFFYFLLMALYFNTEILRESLAVAVFINAYDYIKQKKWLKYYLCVLIAIGFHTSALITLFIPLVKNFKFNKLFWVILIIFVSILYVFQADLGLLALYLDPDAGEKLEKYLSADRFNINWIIVHSIKNIILPSFIIYIYKKRKKTIEYENMLALYIIIGFGAIFLQIIFSRITNYFVFYYIILLADILPNLRVSKYRLISIFSVSLFCLYIYYTEYFIPNTNGILRYSRWYPYHSIITKKTDADRESLWGF